MIKIAEKFRIGKPKGKAELAPLKSTERSNEKIKDYKADGKDASHLTDVLRGTITYDTMTDMYRSVRYLVKEFKVKQYKDTYKNPDPITKYGDIKILVEVGKKGEEVIAEIQLHVRPMYKAKIKEQPNYTERRVLRPRLKELEGKIEKNTATVSESKEFTKGVRYLENLEQKARDIYEPAWKEIIQ